MRFQWRVHKLLWNLSGGRLGTRAIGMPVLELVTTGHRSGEPRSILISYVPMPAGPAIAGTNAGADRDPAWVKNLRVDPKARVREDGKWREVNARFTEGPEWDAAWDLFLDHSGYADYQRMLTRHIPIVVLEDVDA
jgi:deazaflavin-dependent oxidoreductase (nitroreductase family)